MLKTRVTERVRVGTPGGEDGRTHQSFKDECDINRILSQYVRTGTLSHFARYSPQYGDFPAVDFREAVELVQNAQKMFDDLPAAVRKRFDNDAAAFLEFVQDPANVEEMAELGLRDRVANDPPKKKADLKEKKRDEDSKKPDVVQPGDE